MLSITVLVVGAVVTFRVLDHAMGLATVQVGFLDLASIVDWGGDGGLEEGGDYQGQPEGSDGDHDDDDEVEDNAGIQSYLDSKDR